jgi:curved DNA-binding protein CbpA
VLGVANTASDDEVKKAYRELARKYHPDNYVNNPLADLAQEKMKEINEAYDQITKMRQGGASPNSGARAHGNSGGGGYYNPGAGATRFAHVRQLIMQGNLDAAESELNAASDHGAEWYFLMGNVYARRGWYDEARRYFQTACQMEPKNMDYRMACQNSGNTNTYYNQNRGMGGASPCDMCSGLLCADCCCESMGGDLIPCC